MKRYSREIPERSSPPPKRQQASCHPLEHNQQREASLAYHPAGSKTHLGTDDAEPSRSSSIISNHEVELLQSQPGVDSGIIHSIDGQSGTSDGRSAAETSAGLDTALTTSNPNNTIPSNDPHSGTELVFRIRGIALDSNHSDVISILKDHSMHCQAEIELKTLALDAHGRSQVATVWFKTALKVSSPLSLLESTISRSGKPWKADTDFHGLTVLHCPPVDMHSIDIIAVSGLGGHAYGSFKEKSGKYMWLSDSLPSDIKHARVITYGYASGLANSTSFQNLGDLGRNFAVAIQISKEGQGSKKPTIFIAHSLGGLILKEAIVHLSRRKTNEGLEALHSIYGALFFGVPNDGLDVASFIPMVENGPNRSFVESLGRGNSEVLKLLRERFLNAFDFKGSSEIHCFYETQVSRTARREDSGTWSMNGELQVLVTPTSATHCRSWEDKDDYTYPLHRDHSNLVKFGLQDPDYDTVLHILGGITYRAIHRQDRIASPSDGSINIEEPSMMDEQKKRILLDSLRFDQIDARHETIKKAHAKTCSWLLRKAEYLDWLDSNKLEKHYGFLWIKGKPGAGKSTLMKFILNAAQKNAKKNSARTVISFFFNARGDDLEKSTTGMYRSLLLQLLERLPNVPDIFGSHNSPQGGMYRQWSVESLKEMFEKTVLELGNISLECFIDALDECDEDQIRDMISFLEQLGQRTTSAGVTCRICFSSRHYPNISMATALTIVLEGQEGHDQDIISYLNSELKIGHGKLAHQIRDELKEKASGVFMWIVLVVRILQKEYDDGRKHTLRQKLRDIPKDLHQLFRDILTRDQHHKDELLLCIQWILFAKKPLRPVELYFAILSDLNPTSILDWDSDDFDEDDLLKFILSSSKGLAETTKSKSPTVQFIHESVRDFLLKEEGLGAVWPDLKEKFESRSHERMKNCCISYMVIGFTSLNIQDFYLKVQSHEMTKDRELAEEKFPFLGYAVQNVLHHADSAQGGGLDQKDFLKDFDLVEWIKYDNLYEKHQVRRHTPKASLLYVLAEHGRTNLVRQVATRGSCFDVGSERYGAPILAALATGNRTIAYELLRAGLEDEPIDSPLHGLCELFLKDGNRVPSIGRNFQFSSRRGLQSYLACEGEEIFLAFVLNLGDARIDVKDFEEWTLLMRAAANGYETIVKLLLKKGSDTEALNTSRQTALSLAAKSGHEAIAKLLLEHGASIDSADNSSRTPLLWATVFGHEATVKLLLENGASIEAADNDGKTPLFWATRTGYCEIVKVLLEHGALINAADQFDRTPLSWVAEEGHHDIVRVLLEHGVSIEAADNGNRTPLSWAAKKGHGNIVRMLLEHGALTEGADNYSRTPLLWATINGHRDTVRLLLEHGALIEAADKIGESPLLKAALYGHCDIVKTLLEFNASTEVTNKQGKTARDLASMHDIVQMLQEHVEGHSTSIASEPR